MILNYPGGPNLIISIHKNKEIFLAGSETCNNGMHKKSFGKQQHKKDSKEIQLVHPKGNQSWMFIGRTDIETEAPILGPPDAKNWLIGKDPDAGKDWGQEKKQVTEDEMVGRHRFSGHEFEQTQRDSEGQPVVLQSMGSQRVRYDWETEQHKASS